MIPAYFSAASALLLLLHLIMISTPVRKFWSRFLPPRTEQEPSLFFDEPPIADGFFSEAKLFVSHHGGWVIFAYKFARFIACIAFLGLSLATFILDEHEERTSGANKLSKGKYDRSHPSDSYIPFSRTEWLQFSLCTTAAYASILGLVSVTAKPRWSRVVSNHLATLLFAVFAVFAYRDLWPLITFHDRPKDFKEGSLLWAKVTILFLSSIVFPLVSPRQYVPVDLANPADHPHPEQTSSWLSMILYTWLDPIVFKASRVPHLSHEELPPLADHDYSRNLKKKSFPHLDPFPGSRKRHIFFGLMKTFYVEYIVLSVMVVLQVLGKLAAPIGINQLLLYVETKGEDAVVRPWVWISCLFLGPLITSLACQWYIYIATRALVHTEAILTQLVFEHALRIRVKAELPDGGKNAGDFTGPPTSDSASVAGSSTAAGDESADGIGDEALPASAETMSTSSPKQGKQKSQGVKEELVGAPENHSSADNLVGKINNLVTTDLSNITEGRDFLTRYAYHFNAFAGLAVMLVLFPLPGYLAQKIQKVQAEKMQKTDARVQTVTETMNVLRMIKLFGWEEKLDARIGERREVELVWIWKTKVLELVNDVSNYVIPLFTMMASYMTFTLIMGQSLTASKVFSSMTVFDILRDQLRMVFFQIPRITQAKVSLDRVNSFLTDTELLDAHTQQDDDRVQLLIQPEEESDLIGFRDAVFAWSSEPRGSLTPSKRKFRLCIDGEMYFQHGHINLVVGPTGSGKTSMLMALLGEMHFMPSGPTSWFNLPRKGGVAYAAQESWVQNETIRANILFGSPYDEIRYKKVLYQCALERDLTLFEAGDQTEVGEKGLTLSGGQKARITLARAIYSSANMLLLDDVLAALDVHTSKWIVEKCFAGDLVRDRTLILVTHNVAMASSVAHFIVSMGSDGQIVSHGSISEAMTKELAVEMVKEQEVSAKEAQVVNTPEEPKAKSDGKLVTSEEIAVGHISWPAFKLYLTGLGGNYPMMFWVVFLALVGLMDLTITVQTWFLGYWASQYEHHLPSEVNVNFYLSGSALLVFITCLMFSVGYYMYYCGSMRASRTIHKKLVQSILGTTLRWLDTTPTSRVITRCTQDIRAIDGPFAEGIVAFVQVSWAMITRLGAVVVMTPVFLVPGLFIGLLGAWIGRIYMKAQLSVKREMSNAKAPVLGHFGAAIAGLISIRAYGAEEAFKEESLDRIDRYTKSARMFYNLNRWVFARIDIISGGFSAGLATYLVYGRGVHEASNIGFSLNMAVSFSAMILWWVRTFNEVEVSGNSLERIDSYIKIEQEPKPTEGGQPPAYWPASGDLRVENLSARYSLDGPKVLQDLSFHIRSGERVGIVGRTGSGKSSLTLSLLRCIFIEGDVYYDGIPTSGINLSALRSNVTIIPQIPELLSGTLRQNLDLFDEHDDAVLYDALRAAGLFFVQDESEARLTLDSAIASGGGNLSVGQRQILALARAMVRGSKVLILDEATSAIDYKTDCAIQSSLRNELNNVTQIIVAHRLQTIIDADKIMVLDAGKLPFGAITK
ncbi:P-loop containing nucleoside triphosphate hydrolase protein [Suillus decipiens]|nr:P-loop containing nucleoside triphosphate hydrolase protein [Suillus decipiens]